MRTITHQSESTAGSGSAQESIKALLKSLLEGAVGVVARRAGGKASARKGKTRDQVSVAAVGLSALTLTQEIVDALAEAVAKILVDVGNQQVAITRAMLTAALAQLEVTAIQSKAVSVTPAHAAEDETELTTEEAAKLLFVSRPYMVKLLDTNIIPMAHRTVGVTGNQPALFSPAALPGTLPSDVQRDGGADEQARTDEAAGAAASGVA